MRDGNKFVQWCWSGFQKNLEQLHGHSYDLNQAILLAVVGSLFIPSIDLSDFQMLLGVVMALASGILGFIAGTFKPDSSEEDE